MKQIRLILMPLALEIPIRPFDLQLRQRKHDIAKTCIVYVAWQSHGHPPYLDLESYVRHYVEVYDRADDEIRSILPLARIWWPA